MKVLDARDPLGCRCPRVEQAVLASGGRKKLVLVLNKIDLVPREVVEAWLAYLRKEFPTIAFKASTQTQRDHLSQRGDSLNAEGSACKGASTLLKLLANYCRNKNIKTGIRVGIVGFPNVGKSRSLWVTFVILIIHPSSIYFKHLHLLHRFSPSRSVLLYSLFHILNP